MYLPPADVTQTSLRRHSKERLVGKCMLPIVFFNFFIFFIFFSDFISLDSRSLGTTGT